jgi:hypothetical protein
MKVSTKSQNTLEKSVFQKEKADFANIRILNFDSLYLKACFDVKKKEVICVEFDCKMLISLIEM